MPLTTRITQHPGNQIQEQPEIRARDCGGSKEGPPVPTNAHITQSAAIDDVVPHAHASGLAPHASACAPACRAPGSGRGALAHSVRATPTGAESPEVDETGLGVILEADRPLVEAMAFFEAPEAQPPLPSEQMIYTPIEDVYTFRPFPNLPVIPPSTARGWEAVQLNLTHDGAFGAALVVLASDPAALARLIRRSDKPGHYIVTLKLPSLGGDVLDIPSLIDARVPATEQGHILGWADPTHVATLWPLIVAKATGKLVRVLRASGHLPPHDAAPALTYIQFCTWLMGRAPEIVTDLNKVLASLSQSSARGLALQVPTSAPVSLQVPGGTVTSALGGLAHRLRSHAGNIDVLLLNGHHYGVVAAAPGKHVTLYNPLGFNPHPSLADTPDNRFFDPHSLGHGSRTSATIELPVAWLKAICGTWFL